MSLRNFTNEDMELLRRVISDVISARQNSPGQDVLSTLRNAPEVYIALVPSGGIPADDNAGTGTEGDSPGSAECTVFQIVEGELLGTEITKTVYNLSDTVIAEGWLLVVRDKFGSWIAVTGGGAGETCDPRNEIHDITYIGNPDGGYASFLVTVNAVEETLILYWNSSAAYVQSVWESHSQIGSGNVLVTGGPLPSSTIRIEFQGTLASTPITPPLCNWDGLGDVTGSGTGTGTGTAVDGTGVGVVVTRVQAGFSA